MVTIKIGGTNRDVINIGEAPMVKIKDFTLAFKNLGRGMLPLVLFIPHANEVNTRLRLIDF